MARTNENLSVRADQRLGTLLANGGILSPEQSSTFLDYVQDEPTIVKQARVERMVTPTKKINRMGFKTRLLHTARQDPLGDGSENRALTNAERKRVTTSQLELNTTEYIAEVRIGYEVLEDNIERGNFEDHVFRQMAQQVARDVEELALNGDTASSDLFLKSKDGWLKRMNVNVVNNASAGISPEMFDQGLLALPQRYHRRMDELKNFVSVANGIKYRAKVAKRQTGYGDAALTQNIPLYAGGIPLETAPLLVSAGANPWGAQNGVSKDTGFLTFPKNLIIGIQRQITVEYEKLISEREVKFVLTMRIDVQIDEPEAAVKYTNI